MKPIYEIVSKALKAAESNGVLYGGVGTPGGPQCLLGHIQTAAGVSDYMQSGLDSSIIESNTNPARFAVTRLRQVLREYTKGRRSTLAYFNDMFVSETRRKKKVIDFLKYAKRKTR